MGDCDICQDTGQVKVGWHAVAGSTYKIKVEYDPCPNCTDGPHSFHAKQFMAQIIATRLRDSLTAPEARHG